ncbi:DnaJ (Hsp40), sub C, member 2, variant 2 [Clonorchis sinensis]|uniref:DnaJ (Hsp40), sub C, member 2 n=1 Tax=Clonorchis sinensis TaxID=79923 RepID=A0A8T1M8R1_CLOSI|nr:DnaJ (Hsp40), sub C, member 2 [Clonorchis sinensis]KAG5445235.1 DnaJ (Hsp40), sub C, member 2, variant 2 [Clonorchis sinensis]
MTAQPSYLEIIPFELHPHVAIIRDLLGYTSNEPEWTDPDEEDDEAYLRSLDPKDWKTHDYYAILGLKKLRHLASADDIRRAYRRKLLTHHPDKRRAAGERVKDESHDYFSCITIAYEILGNPTKRHAYDSVDPLVVDDSVPTVSEIKADFWGSLRGFFARKARWSKKQPVPGLGGPWTNLDDVHSFYDFWDEYDTIRDYSFLDEEDKEKGEDRESRRAIERQNRIERARRRAEELRTIRQVVELARSNDPRLLAAGKAARDAKAAKRQARLDALRQRREAEEQQARLEAEKLAAERAASEERRRIEAERLRKEREQTRLESRRERRRLREIVVERHDHFVLVDPQPTDPGAERVRVLAALDLICQRLSNTHLQELNNQLEQISSVEEARSIFNSKHQEVQQELQAPGLQFSTKTSNASSTGTSAPSTSKYPPEVIRTLIKAVNLLPAGTPKRWEAIAAYVNQHAPGTSISAKEALKQAKSLSQDDVNLRKEANEKAFDSFASSVRDSDAVKNVSITSQLEAEADRPWTVTEQRALEQALRSFPTQSTEGDRWQRIADVVGTRTRRECMVRCKELAEQVRAKKAALSAAKTSVPNGTIKPLANASTKSK